MNFYLRIVSALITLVFPLLISAQYDTLTVMTYNVLNFSENSPDREDDFRVVTGYVKPDVILVNEMISDAGAIALLDNSLNVYGENSYQKATFTDGPDTDNMLYYNSNKLVLYSQWYIQTDLRYINEYVLYYKTPGMDVGSDTVFIYLYTAHLKSSQGNEQLRLAEVQQFRNRVDNLPFVENIILGGDLNLYTSSEPAYDALTNQGTYPLDDPLPAGNWHDNESLRFYHTQSTRLTNFGGGASGGMDDRFDFILYSDDVQSGDNKIQYLENSCMAVGNDGAHYGLAIIDPPVNTSVPDSVLNALYFMSDHLPVIADFRVELNQGVATSDLVITEIMYNPPEAGTDSLEFIEIYNKGNSDLPLLNYFFTGVNFVFPAVVLSPGEFIVTAVNSQAMTNTFGIDALEWNSGGLLNGGEEVKLYDNSGNLIDSVFYDDTTPWPPEADGDGYSLSLCDPESDNALGENWQASTEFVTNNESGDPIYASPGYLECDLSPIADFTAANTTISEGENIQFTDLSVNNPTSWQWTFQGGTPEQATIQNPLITYSSPGTYDVSLTVSNPAGTDALIIEDYITVLDSDPVVIITEIMQNPSSVTDENGEWFELYNPTAFPVDLQNWIIKDDDFDQHSISNSVIVPANGFVVLGRNLDQISNGGYTGDYQYTGFLLANGDDEVIILNPDNEEIDRVEYDGGPFWPDPNGASMVFTGTVSDNNTDPGFWTTASLREENFSGSSGDEGSPGTNGSDQQIQQTKISIGLKVFLEGPFNGAMMNTNLNQRNLIPLDQPFNVSPWFYTGTEAVSSISDPAIVDWMLVELRDAPDILSADLSTQLARKAVFLKDDGTITGIEGNTLLLFDVTVSQNLFVVLYHRNHLGIISSSPVTKSGDTYSYDFTTGAFQAYNDGQTEIFPSIWGMIAGDADASASIDINDLDPGWKMKAGKSEYSGSDLNLNGEINNQDKNDFWLPNLGKSSQVQN